LRKPFDPEHLREVVRAALDHQSPLSGNLGELSPGDVLQMLCLSQKTTALRVVDGQSSGMILIDKGEVVHAVWEELSGEEAFFHLLQATKGMFCTLPLPVEAPRSVRQGWQHLLLEAMRRVDEEQAGIQSQREPRASSDRPTTTARTASPDATAQAPAGSPITKLVDEGFAAIRARDLETARRKWEEASKLDPDNRTIQLNLRRLERILERQ
jgi:hypothetical protein